MILEYSNVRVLCKPKFERLEGWMPKYREIDDPGPWLVIFNPIMQRWIVSNEPAEHGMQAEAETIQLHGYGETLNAALFVVYEHQRSLGLERTILDELREVWSFENAMVIADGSEWDWDYDPKIIQNVLDRIEGEG
ncbi:hypothetical protein DFQ01_14420 [Paenibacillus cellulosilyticus]|uniref:Uncharacterized protein n=1 Tax=Paenibacillus cellulosilyticus TaxID=375489 RepID=A0A2V2YEU8_9BACL|nr:hypothetical protein [Paenibacillus cellulosilyticus]PWV90244.1 hypothetical protein DFQ01_14420 [Paenibacillus cellulosilyticus]QKS43402.1 hypothetical protein HUB94_02455 [Paenibacillus cellulosilyticus]